jgi:7-cyano-7-deazaguanine synthase
VTSCAVLFSGGIDSTTALYWARERFADVFPLTFDYGQRHRVEIRLSGRLLRRLKLRRTLLRVDLRQVGGSALTDAAIAVPRAAEDEGRKAARRKEGGGESPPAAGPPATYVPFRNGIFLAMAAAWAEAREVRNLVCGFHVLDSPDYPDTGREFVRAMEHAVNLGTSAAFGRPRMRILAPFVGMSKADIIRTGIALGADYAYSVSCYAGGEVPCGECASCRMRAKGWSEGGREDPLLVRLRKEGKL